MENFFSELNEQSKPLAERMRPNSLNEFVGQEHILEEGKLLRRLIEASRVPNVIFWGPPGTGKTSLAHIIAKCCKGEFRKLNAVSSGVADAKKIIDEAKANFELYGRRTYLLLDECHRWSKAQSDSILSAIEQGFLILIGSTTENPAYAMTRAIVSRCSLFEFKPLTQSSIKAALISAIASEKGLKKACVKIDNDALDFFVKNCAGDLRIALNALEVGAVSSKRSADASVHITLDDAKECLQKPSISLNEDLKFNILSAFCKSLRGSDCEAALYYSSRLIAAGFPAETIARRVIAHASEDVGMADSNALTIACNALFSIQNLGVPEGLIPLSHAIIYVCEAPKSNSVIVAKGRAEHDAQFNPDDNIPPYLINHTDASKDYKYPHDFGGYCAQEYLPKSLKNVKYYEPSNNGGEKNLIRKKKN